MLEDTGDIWSVPASGGPVRIAFAGPRIDSCDTSLAMWSDARGLFWLRGIGPFGAPGQRLYFMPWSTLASR
jgi:hypothetical protein